MTLVEKTLWAHQRLNQQYGIQAIYGYKDPMHELVGTILSHRTTHANEVTAYRTMRERFPSWEDVRDAPLTDLIDTIKTANYPDVKAPDIQQLLTVLMAERGETNIDFLADLPTHEAMHWLTRLPGIGPKTATLLLLFTFHKPVLPVDTHIHRVTQRLGVISPKVSADKAHNLLLAALPADAVELFNFHKHFYWHGQRTCTWFTPQCNNCVLAPRCDYRQSSHSMVLSSTSTRKK